MGGHSCVAAVAVALAAAVGGCGSESASTSTTVDLSNIGKGTDGTRAPASKRRAATRRELAPARRRKRPAAADPSAIEQMPIPFGPRRKQEMAAYAQRHYGISSYELRDPKVIVIHFTQGPDARSAYNTFAPDNPDVELHELPGVCSHFVIDRDGTTYQLVPLAIMCRHTVGLNYTAIGIEHAGFSDQEVLNNRAELDASLLLTRWLQCKFGIKSQNVIGHNESLSSPYHRENVARLRSQTHGDFVKASMDTYRAKLGADPCS